MRAVGLTWQCLTSLWVITSSSQLALLEKTYVYTSSIKVVMLPNAVGQAKCHGRSSAWGLRVSQGQRMHGVARRG
jgi:hypothetical protein